MAAKLTILQVPVIAEPCHQPWEAMPGSARRRHCAACDQDVVNLAAHSSAEIAVLLQSPAPPCIRMARHANGALITTEPVAASRRPRLAAGVLTAAMSLAAAAQQESTRPVMGAVAPSLPRVTGRITSASGQPLPHARLVLLDRGKAILSANAGPDGSYSLAARPGHYQLRIDEPGSLSQTLAVDLEYQKPAKLAVKLDPVRATMGRFLPPPTVTMGVPAVLTGGRVARPEPAAESHSHARLYASAACTSLTRLRR